MAGMLYSGNQGEDYLARPVGLDGGNAREKAYEAIEGEPVPWYKINPWRQVWASSPGAMDGFPRGAVLKVKITDPFDLGLDDTERLAVLWDGEKLAGPVQFVEQGAGYLIEIPGPPKGERLEIWLTDDVEVQVSIRPPSAKDAVRAELTEEAEREGWAEKAVGKIGDAVEAERARSERMVIYLLVGVVVVSIFVLPELADKKLSVG